MNLITVQSTIAAKLTQTNLSSPGNQKLDPSWSGTPNWAFFAKLFPANMWPTPVYWSVVSFCSSLTKPFRRPREIVKRTDSNIKRGPTQSFTRMGSSQSQRYINKLRGTEVVARRVHIVTAGWFKIIFSRSLFAGAFAFPRWESKFLAGALNAV